MGGKTIRLQHLGRGHTGGDLVVLFVEDRVLHTGDLFFNGRYPNIDLEAGGSVREWDATLDRVLALDFDRVIPGHGPVTDREGIRAFQRFLRELWSLAERGAREGKSLAETQALPGLTADAGYQAIGDPVRVQARSGIRDPPGLGGSDRGGDRGAGAGPAGGMKGRCT